MSQENRIFTINIVKTNDLGLKIVVAKDKNTDKCFAVITEVNPIGVCFKENVKLGDVLLSINGIHIDNYNVLHEFVTSQLHGKDEGHEIQLTIHKKAALDIPGLFRTCFNSPCSELCKIWDPSRPKLLPKVGVTETSDKPIKIIPERQTNFKLYTNEPISLIRKSSYFSTDDSVSPISLPVENSPRYKYQRAIPMKRKDNDQRYNRVILKPKNPTPNHIIAPPQPLFIKRKNPVIIDQFPISNLKESKSLTNIANLSNDNYSKDSSESDSSSSSVSCDSFDCLNDVHNPSFHVFQQKKFSLDGNASPQNARNLSKSTDVLLTDLKQELARQKLKHTPISSWKYGMVTEKGISKNNPTTQLRH